MTRIAITGGTGFVGRHLAERLVAAGHDVVVVARGIDRHVPPPTSQIHVVHATIGDRAKLQAAFRGCDAVVHCAGINREIGAQTYEAVHIEGTRVVADAARSAGGARLVMLSFLRARPDGPSEYHRTKWAAEQIVRTAGSTHTIVKAGVIYGRGDHMLDHLSRAFHTFPIFGLVGLRDRQVRPIAVTDVVRLLEAAALGDRRLEGRTVLALGPEELPLGAAVRRVAMVVGRRPMFVPLPVAVHRVLARIFEAAMTVPLIARAQVEILAEGVVAALPFADEPPDDLRATTPFSEGSIRAGLPPASRFGRADLRVCRGWTAVGPSEP